MEEQEGQFSCRRPQVVAGDNLGALRPLTGQLGCRETAKGVDAGQCTFLVPGVVNFTAFIAQGSRDALPAKDLGVEGSPHPIAIASWSLCFFR